MSAIVSACSSEELSALEEFTRRTDGFEDAVYTVTYQVDGVAQVDSVSEGVASSTRVTVYSDGSSRRVDYEFDEGMQVRIATEAAQYSCWSDPGLELSCFENPGGGRSDPSYGLDAFAYMIQSPEDSVLSRADDRSVAGVDSECFLVAYEDVLEGEPVSEICLADDGLVVYASMINVDPTLRQTTQAVEIVRSVPKSIFEQPYPLSPCNAGLGAPGCPDISVEE